MEPVQPVIKQSNFLITLLSILLSISVFIAGFFAFQTQNLVKELIKLKTIPTPTPVETISLRSYTSDNLDISIQFPDNLIVSDGCLLDKKQCGLSLGLEGTGGLFFEISKIFNTTVAKMFESDSKQYSGFLDSEDRGPVLIDSIVDSVKAKETTFKNAVYGTDVRIIYIQIANDVFKIILPAYADSSANQVLSTFKFIEPVACTMEAKICPDGSSIGRTGPKCEFTPCPTP